MKVLVAGGAGYIGSHCVRQLAAAGHRPVVLDNLAAGMAEDEVVRLYPSVSVNDVHAAVSYAAELARERLVTLAA